jgi:hypothetical protein
MNSGWLAGHGDYQDEFEICHAIMNQISPAYLISAQNLHRSHGTGGNHILSIEIFKDQCQVGSFLFVHDDSKVKSGTTSRHHVN